MTTVVVVAAAVVVVADVKAATTIKALLWNAFVILRHSKHNNGNSFCTKCFTFSSKFQIKENKEKEDSGFRLGGFKLNGI